jgi:hypothetical protein
LLPGAKLDEPAAWDTESLQEYGRRRLVEQAAEINRKLTTTGVVAAVAIIGVCLVSATAIYQFLPATQSTPVVPATPPGFFDPLPADPLSQPASPHDSGNVPALPSGDDVAA